jgi:Cd2+/Zn2+-exporting ATPase
MLPMAPPEPPEVEPEPAPLLDATAARFRVDGMDCASCAKTVEKAVAGLAGVRNAQVSFGNATLLVDGDVDAAQVQAVVARAGYRAQPPGRHGEPVAPFWRRDVRTVSTFVSVVVLVVAVIASLAGAPRLAVEPLYLLSMAVGGWHIAQAALAGLRRGSLDMNVLMTLAAVGAVGIGAYAEGAWVLVLFAVGTTLESYAFDRSRRSVSELMELAPAQARILGEDGSEQLVPVEEVTVGTRVLVRPGERVALDGEVLSGNSSVDEAPITGESVPVEKQAGSTVFAGTLNAQGALTVRATKAAGASTLARVAALVEEAQGSRAPSERFVDRFARIYTPLVFAAALTLIVIPVAVFGGELDTWVYRALALLIVACPCSLVISVPVAVVSAVGHAARGGVLIKSGQALEDLARVKAVAIDKTGTLTRGVAQLTDIVTLDDTPRDEALSLAAAVERQSEHPLAEALVRAARDQGLPVAETDAFHALPGRGVTATIAGRELWAGGPRLADVPRDVLNAMR